MSAAKLYYLPPGASTGNCIAGAVESTELIRVLTLNSLHIDRYAQYVHIDTYVSHKEASMRTTLNIEDALIEKAALLTGITEKTSLVRLGLQALIARESSKRLALLGGSEKNLMAIPRRRGDA